MLLLENSKYGGWRRLIKSQKVRCRTLDYEKTFYGTNQDPDPDPVSQVMSIRIHLNWMRKWLTWGKLGRLGVFFSDRERRDVRCLGREEETGVLGSSLCSDSLNRSQCESGTKELQDRLLACTVISKFKAIQPGIYLSTVPVIRYSIFVLVKKVNLRKLKKKNERKT